MPESRYRAGFRPDIEGLRAIAVIAVVGFHAAVPGMSGGYVGVDVFFVISGFLITGLILGDLERRGTFSLREFYARRARRILPAAGVVLTVTSIVGAFWLNPLRRQDTAFDVLAAALNASNWRFIALQTDYLAAGRAESPLLHYWSLAVEEQFYLVWAPLALIGALLARRLKRSPFPVIAIAITAITAVSFVLCLKWTVTDTPLAYLSSPSRAWQFGIGALGAMIAPAVGKLLPKPISILCAIAGVTAVFYSVIAFDNTTHFPGTAAILPTLGTAAVLLAGAGMTKPLGLAWVLATPPVRFAGRLSYSWYLWHWPVLVLWEAEFGYQPWQSKALLMLGSAVPAWITMKLVESPIRLSPVVSAMPWRGLTVGLAAILLPVGAGLFMNASALSALAAASTTVLPPPVPAAAESGSPMPSDEGHIYLSPLPLIPVGPPQPSPAQARKDLPAVGGCQVAPGTTSNGTCLFGDNSSRERVILFGDSHAMQWFPAITELAAKNHWAVEVLGKSGCAVHTYSTGTNAEYDKDCTAWRDKTVSRILNGPKPKFIFVSTMMERGYTGQHYIDTWDVTLKKLTATTAPIVYLRDSPYPGSDMAGCVSGMPIGSDTCDFNRDDSLFPDAMAEVIKSGARQGVYLADFSNALCPRQKCQAVIDGIMVYRDHSHLTATAAKLLAPRLEKQLIEQKLIQPGA